MTKIVAGMATIPERVDAMLEVVDRISPQVDQLYIYFNGDCTAELGDIVLTDLYNNVTVKTGKDIGANGKFYFLDEPGWDYYLSIDDDFFYPQTYAETMVRKIEKYNREVAVCCHGSIFPPRLDWYFERLNVFAAREEVDEDKLVSLAGSGTLAFHRDTFPKISYSTFEGAVKCDLVFSMVALLQKTPIVSIKRRKDWLRPIPTTGRDYWSTSLSDDKGRTELAQTVDWSFKPSKYFPEKPKYWKEKSQTHLITRYRFLMKELCGGIYDLKYFMSYPTAGLREMVESLEKVHSKIKG